MTDKAPVLHASPPAGHWINDPNGLFFADGAFRLLVQHRSDFPIYRRTGWARFSSPDLLRWTFDGPVIPPEDEKWMYSGCVVPADDGWACLHTVHAGGVERQVRRQSTDGGASWGPAEPLANLGPPARNRRDPFACRDQGGWALLLAEPCDWTEWRNEEASRLALYRSNDGWSWRRAGTIGPLHPPGVIWEVPLLLRVDGHDVLVISSVDRRGGGADCAVRAWTGTLAPGCFIPDAGVPAEGQLLDLGPDFYAAIASVNAGWPLPRPCIVGWLSNWTTARKMRWPGFAGGPISLPRSISIEQRNGGPFVAVRPHPAVLAALDRQVDDAPQAGLGRARCAGGTLRLEVEGDDASLDVTMSDDLLEVSRVAGGLPDWRRRHRIRRPDAGTRSLAVVVDACTTEVFLPDDGVAISAGIPSEGGGLRVRLTVDGEPAHLAWTTLAA